MKTKKIYFFTGIILTLLFISCEGSFDFNKEQYQKGIYIMGGGDAFKIYDRNIANLDQATDTLYITVGVGGSQLIDKDIKVTITPTDSLFKAYNKSWYDTAQSKWAHLLPPKTYTLLTNETVIKAGESTATIPVELKNLNQLSPDSVYFLDYKILGTSGYPITPNKGEAMFRIFYKNHWSNTKSISDQTYILSAQRWTQGNNDTLKIAGSPRVFPLSKNSVRVAASTLSVSNLAEINANSMVLIIDNANKVSFVPYKTIQVEALPSTAVNNPYNNTFVNEVNKISEGKYTYYKTFWLRYRFRLNDKDTWKVVESRLRHQYNPMTGL